MVPNAPYGFPPSQTRQSPACAQWSSGVLRFLLNNALLIGPDLLENLIHVFIHIHQYQYAVSANIEGKFLQFGVIPEDPPSLRSLWRGDSVEEIANDQYVRHIFEVNDSPTCAQNALSWKTTDDQTRFPGAICKVKNNLHINDYLELSLTAEEVTRKPQYLVKMLAKGGFALTIFVSNVCSVFSTINGTENLSHGNVKALAAEDVSSHVLELEWNYRLDTLVVSRGTTPDRNRILTQRVVLSLISAVYDPIGLIAPYAVEARLRLKDIWRLSGQQCDDNFPDHIVDKFVQWIDEITKLTEIKMIPRSCFDRHAGR